MKNLLNVLKSIIFPKPTLEKHCHTWLSEEKSKSFFCGDSDVDTYFAELQVNLQEQDINATFSARRELMKSVLGADNE